MGAKAYEQSAGFLRIKNGDFPLDDSAVHPESYDLVKKIAKDQNLKIEALIGNKEVLKNINLEKYITSEFRITYAERYFERTGKTGCRSSKSNR